MAPKPGMVYVYVLRKQGGWDEPIEKLRDDLGNEESKR